LPGGKARAAMLTLHQFSPYQWLTPFEEALKPWYQKYTLDYSAHPDKMAKIM